LHRQVQWPTFQHPSPAIMRSSLLLLAFAFPACQAGGRPTATPPSQSEQLALSQRLTAQLERSAADWDRGDLAGFLSDYAPESTTTYVDGRRARHGFEFIRDNYAPRFAPGARRDSLHFEEVEVRPLSPTLALVTARFLLQRSGATTASGPFTLIMELRPEGWRILHDHTSSDPK
jgi:ketosteroid isomerase-like protein